jgi:hypothetical protein
MTTQEAYEKIRNHFLQPDAVFAVDPRSGIYGKGSCIYRGDYDPHSPVRCAFGVLIPDHLYKLQMETKTAEAVLRDHDTLADALKDGDQRYEINFVMFVDEAQSAHDTIATSEEPSIADFINTLDELAIKFGLSVYR